MPFDIENTNKFPIRIPDATELYDGLMSAADKAALDNLVGFSRGGVVPMASGGSGDGFDYYDVTFSTPYPIGYTYQFTATASPSDPNAPLVVCDVVSRTNTGMRIRPSAQFDGVISWSTK